MNYVENLIDRYPNLSVCRGALEKAIEAIVSMHNAGGILLICGNGGSAADSEHISGELLKGFLSLRSLSEAEKSGLSPEIADCLQGGIKAIPLQSLTSVLSAFGNDVSPDLALAQLVWVFGEPSGVFLGISTSGNAKNVCAAAEVARAKGMKTVAMTGQGGGKLAQICDVVIKAPETETYKIQELHLPVYHAICAETEAQIFGD